VLLATFSGAALAATQLVAQETSATIYQDGRVLVRRTLPVAVARGTSTVSVDLGTAALDLGSVVSLVEGAEIRGASLTLATGLDAALRRSLGREVEFRVASRDTVRYVRATLLSLDPPTVRLDGRIAFELPGTPVFPDSIIQLAPAASLTLVAAHPARSLRLGYMTQGLSWRASYAFVVPRTGAGRGVASGTAVIENAGLTARGAELQLAAGEIRAAPRSRFRREAGGVAEIAAVTVATPAAPQGVGEVYIYTLPGTHDLTPGVTRSVALFPDATIDIEPEYLLQPFALGVQQRWPDAMRDLHSEVSYLVRRPRQTAFGDAPLPVGVARVYAPDTAGRLQLLGEVSLGHTAAGHELHLTTGTAFDLTAERTQLTYEPRGRRESVSSYRVRIENAKAEDVTVQVLERFPGQLEVLSSTVPPERLSAQTLRFPVRVPAGGEAVLEYRVRARW
jgi:hypothetical protein